MTDRCTPKEQITIIISPFAASTCNNASCRLCIPQWKKHLLAVIIHTAYNDGDDNDDDDDDDDVVDDDDDDNIGAGDDYD